MYGSQMTSLCFKLLLGFGLNLIFGLCMYRQVWMCLGFK